MAIYCEHQKVRGHCPMCGQQAETRYVMYKEGTGFLVNAERGIFGYSRTVSSDKADALVFQSLATAIEAEQFIKYYEEGFKIYDWSFQPKKTIQFEYVIKNADMFLTYWKSAQMSADNKYTFGKLESEAIRFPNWDAANDVARLCASHVMAITKE